LFQPLFRRSYRTRAVFSAVVDGIASDRSAGARTVPVCRDNDSLYLQLRVSTLDHADDLVARDLLDGRRDLALPIDPERERLEAVRIR
jgi:hypothetical protein